jgi:NAD(P)-dependent dehydrogenase (short-subunit alcohol dehydrogenase family)
MHTLTKLAAFTLGGLAIGSLGAKYAMRQSRHFEWRGKRVLLTGGSRGLGLVLARKLIAQGARLAICSRTAKDLEIAHNELASLLATVPAGQVASATCDVGDPQQVSKFVRQVVQEFGGVDVAINAAGIIEVGPWESMTKDDFEECMSTNCWGALNTARAVFPFMKQQGWGRILNVASFGGQVPFPHLAPYNVSKFALVGLSTSLRAEFAKDNILVVTVCPGLMRTGSPRNATFKGQNRKEYAWFSISDSLPVLSLDAEDAADRILRACQDGDPLVEIPGVLAPLLLAARWAPNWTIELLAVVNRLLPAMGGIGQQQAKGYESESKLTRSPLTRLGDIAAARNNEIRS